MNTFSFQINKFPMITDFTASVCVCVFERVRASPRARHTRAQRAVLCVTPELWCADRCSPTTPQHYYCSYDLFHFTQVFLPWRAGFPLKERNMEWVSDFQRAFVSFYSVFHSGNLRWSLRSVQPHLYLDTHNTRFWYLYENLPVFIHKLLRRFNTLTGYRFVDIFCKRSLDGCHIALSGHQTTHLFHYTLFISTQ